MYLAINSYPPTGCTVKVDDVRLYNRTLTQSQIGLLYAPCPNDGNFNEVTFTCGCPSGSVTVDSDCQKCLPGKFAVALAPSCVDCPVNTYASMSGSSTCVSCTSYASSPESSMSVTNCTCNAGATGNGTVCMLCAAGKYKNASGSASCDDCPANTYATLIGANSLSVCVNCPVNSTSASGSPAVSSCRCSPGFTGPGGGVCVACASGKYKTVNGTATCTDCWAGSYSGALGANSSDTCLSCPNNSWVAGVGSSLVTACTCNAGASGPNGGPCALCVPGKYKTVSRIPSKTARG